MTIQRQPSLRRLDWHYMAMQIGFWAMFASIVGYQTALLLDRGFSNGEAGLMTSVRCLAGIVCQPLLGGFADRHPEFPLKRIVSLSMLLSLGVSVWYWLAPGMGLGETALVWAVIGGLEVSSYPLMDAMAIQFINDGVPIRYSLGRGLGSLAYALTCVFLGFQVGRSGVESTLLTHVVLVAAEIALVATYPPYRGRPRARDAEGPRPQSALALLQSHGAVGKGLYTDFGALGVQNGGHGGAQGVPHLLEHIQPGQLLGVAAVREVEAGSVHAGPDQPFNGLRMVHRRAKGADDLCLSHIHAFIPPSGVQSLRMLTKNPQISCTIPPVWEG